MTSFLCVSNKEDEASFDVIKAGHITKLLDEDLSADLDSLHVQKAILAVSELLEDLKSYREDYTSDKHKVKLFFSRRFALGISKDLKLSALGKCALLLLV